MNYYSHHSDLTSSSECPIYTGAQAGCLLSATAQQIITSPRFQYTVSVIIII